MMLAIYSLWLRDVIRFLRQPSRVIGALASPVLFWIVPWLKGIPHLDLRVAVMLVSLFYLVGLIILVFLPETKGQALPED